jgi:hypothetical protein
MLAAPGEPNQTSLTICLNMGRVTLHLGTYALAPGDALAQAKVLDLMAQRILRLWPKVASSNELDDFLRKGE